MINGDNYKKKHHILYYSSIRESHYHCISRGRIRNGDNYKKNSSSIQENTAVWAPYTRGAYTPLHTTQNKVSTLLPLVLITSYCVGTSTAVEIQLLCFICYCCCPGNGVDAVILPLLPAAVRLLRDHLPHPPPRLPGLQQTRQRTRQG
jgi:hypothetical protein